MVDPVLKATCLYLKDDLVSCIKFCSKYRQVYLKQKSFGFKKAQFQLDSRKIAKIYILELACYVEELSLDPENTDLQATAHKLLESIPHVVKSREQQ